MEIALQLSQILQDTGCNCFKSSIFYTDWDCSQTATQYELLGFSQQGDTFTVLPHSSNYFWINLSLVLEEVIVIEFTTQSLDAIMINAFNTNNYLQADQSKSLKFGQPANISIDCSSTFYFNNVITIQLYSFFPEKPQDVTLTVFYLKDDEAEIDYKIYITSASIGGGLIVIIILMYLKMRKERIKFQKALDENEKQYKVKIISQREKEQNIELPQQLKLLEDEICAICNKNLNDGKCIKKTSCLHQFHDQCLVNYVQNSNKCPQCNQILETRQE